MLLVILRKYIWCNHQEFVTAQASEAIVGSQLAGQDTYDPLQDFIPGLMSILVVDLFEMINVKKAHPASIGAYLHRAWDAQFCAMARLGAALGPG